MAAPQLRAAPGKILLEVVTPTGMALGEVVEEFTAPSVQGEFGVLPAHLPLMVALRTGMMTFRHGQETTSCAVGPGFVEVADDHAVFLTDRFMKKDAVDVVATRDRLKEVDEKLDTYLGEPGEPDHQSLMADQQWHATLLTLIGDPPPPTLHTFEPYATKAEKSEEAIVEVAEESDPAKPAS